MTKDRKETEMQAVTPLKPLPVKTVDPTRLVQAEVPKPLWDAVEDEIVRRKLTIKEAVVFGLQSFLVAHNPREAAKLGITEK